MHFIKSHSRIIHTAVADAKHLQVYIKPNFIAVMRSDLPHAGDKSLMLLLRLSVKGKNWASDVMFFISKLMANKCDCELCSTSTDFKCDGSFGPFMCDVRKQEDLIRDHCYLEKKTTVSH